MEDVVALLAELVAIDSVNPGLVPGAAGEREIVDRLDARLRTAGLRTHVIEARAADGRPSLVAWTEDPAPVTVLLNGHLDTVGVEGMTAPFSAHRVGAGAHEWLLGRGACDMKGGCAALVVAAERVARSAAPVRVVLALVADEEDRSLGTEAVLAALPTLDLRPDVALVAEPTWLDLATSHRGYAVVDVALTGRAAHSSQPEAGINAVAHLGRVLRAVEDAAPAVAALGGSLMVTVAEGGTAPFTVPATARAVIERRTVPGESAAAALGEVDAILAALRRADPTLDAMATLTHAREAWQLASSGASATFAVRLAEELRVRGRRPGGREAPYWMESALWEAAGIPAVVCGPAGGGLHAVDEWVSVPEVIDFTEALVATIHAWGTGPGHAD